MSKDLILAIDNGTQSTRALIFDLQGNILAKQRVPLQAYFSELLVVALIGLAATILVDNVRELRGR